MKVSETEMKCRIKPSFDKNNKSLILSKGEMLLTTSESYDAMLTDYTLL